LAKMMIGELGNRTGTKVNTIRYYEDIGILPPPVRTDSGRRTYAECDVKRLSFIRHSRSFGFSLAEIRSLLSLSDSPEQDCTLASTIAKSHLERIDMKISQLEGLRHSLLAFAISCSGGRAENCEIIGALCEVSLPQRTPGSTGIGAAIIRPDFS
jgi:DNA-binding transcriptional MerR regulator